MCFVLGVVFMGLIILSRPVLHLFSSMEWLLFSSDRPLADILVLVVSSKLVLGNFLSVILGNIGNRLPLLVYKGGLIVDGGTRCILCEAGVYTPPVVLPGKILLLLSSPGWSFIITCPSWSVATWAISIYLVVFGHQFL